MPVLKDGTVSGNVRGYRVCCADLASALIFGLLETDPVYEELNLGYHPLDERWEIGNAITAETYNPKRFSMSMAIEYCPFCGEHLVDSK